MPLQPFDIEQSPTKGLMQISDRRVLATDQWLTLDNCVFDASGALRKRDGYGVLPNQTITGGTLFSGAAAHPTLTLGPNVTKLFARGNELLAFENTYAATWIHSWSPNRNTWVRLDSACSVSHRAAVASALYGYQYSAQVKRVVSTVTGAYARVHMCLQNTVNNTYGSGFVAYASATDEATGATLFPVSSAGGLSDQYRMMAFPDGGLFATAPCAGVVYNNTDGSFDWQRISPFTGTIDSRVSFTPPVGRGPWDAHEFGDTRFALAYTTLSGITLNTYRVTTGAPLLNQTKAVYSFAPGETCLSLSVYALANVGVWVAIRTLNPTGPAYIVRVMAFADALGLAQQWNTVVNGNSYGSTGTVTSIYASVAARSTGEVAVTYNRGVQVPAAGPCESLSTAILAADGSIKQSGYMVNVSATSRPFYLNSRWYCTAANQSYANTVGIAGTNPPDASGFLLRLDPINGDTAPSLAGLLYGSAIPTSFTNPAQWVPVDADVSTSGLVALVDMPQAILVTGTAGGVTTRVLGIEIDATDPSPALRMCTPRARRAHHDGIAPRMDRRNVRSGGVVRARARGRASPVHAVRRRRGELPERRIVVLRRCLRVVRRDGQPAPVGAVPPAQDGGHCRQHQRDSSDHDARRHAQGTRNAGRRARRTDRRLPDHQRRDDLLPDVSAAARHRQ